MSKPVYLAYYLDIPNNKHQFAMLQHLVQWRDGIEMDEDGCLIFHNEPCVVDGWEPDAVDPNVLIPTADECVDRIHAMHTEPGGVRLEMFCMHTGCSHFKSVVSAATCSGCPFRRARE